MKRAIALILGVVLMLSLVGCFDTAKQDAILKYVNEDLASILELETKFIESYESVSGENYTDDATMYTELVNNTSIYARDLSNAVTNLADSITDADLLAIHKLYMEATTKNSAAITTMISALENADYAQVSTANELLGEASSLLVDYRTKLTALAEENGVTFEE